MKHIWIVQDYVYRGSLGAYGSKQKAFQSAREYGSGKIEECKEGNIWEYFLTAETTPVCTICKLTIA